MRYLRIVALSVAAVAAGAVLAALSLVLSFVIVFALAGL